MEELCALVRENFGITSEERNLFASESARQLCYHALHTAVSSATTAPEKRGSSSACKSPAAPNDLPLPSSPQWHCPRHDRRASHQSRASLTAHRSIFLPYMLTSMGLYTPGSGPARAGSGSCWFLTATYSWMCARFFARPQPHQVYVGRQNICWSLRHRIAHRPALREDRTLDRMD